MADKALGANQYQQNEIRRMTAEGVSAEGISDALAIDLGCVQSTVDDFESHREAYYARWRQDKADQLTRAKTMPGPADLEESV